MLTSGMTARPPALWRVLQSSSTCWLQMQSGAVYCQLVDAYCKSVVAMSKVIDVLQQQLNCLQHHSLHS